MEKLGFSWFYLSKDFIKTPFRNKISLIPSFTTNSTGYEQANTKLKANPHRLN